MIDSEPCLEIPLSPDIIASRLKKVRRNSFESALKLKVSSFSK